ncbi:MAG TPA: adenylate/guanylate cyclase domain-containing protein [Thermoleophilaceae bacterium]|nr:adenylate/guanylate cyclase domain-containing protein [Thermoleophilaceae bacterium]
MPFAFNWLYRRLGSLYVFAYLVFNVASAAVITLGTLGLFALYVDVSAAEFLRVFVISEVVVTIGIAYSSRQMLRAAMPIRRWIKDRDDPLEAWRRAVELPREVVRASGWPPFVIIALPLSVVLPIEFDLPWYSSAIVCAGTLVAIAYAAILHFFSTELFVRPVLVDIVGELPPDFQGQPLGVPLRWKLLGALPLINVITGVVVSGLSTRERASLEDLGLDVIVAVLVAFTISFELTLLVTKSVLGPVDDLLEATSRVREGDLSTRVPVVSGDEMGRLAASFNAMLSGLEERETLRSAFGSYVDPEIAKRVLAEGELLEGEEVEATAMFVDIQGFTAFAEQASAREAVAHLNDFFGLVVPIVSKHGGHANKFVGDGLLAVFGVPERAGDHADRALAAACEIASEVERRYQGGVRIGVGLNSGPVVAGSVGGGGRLEFTVIGDPVNVAARVEKQTRELGEPVLLTEATRCLLADGHVVLEPRGEVSLRGRSEPTRIYAPNFEDSNLSTRTYVQGDGSRSPLEGTKS